MALILSQDSGDNPEGTRAKPGVNLTTLARWEKGKSEPMGSFLKIITSFFIFLPSDVSLILR